MAVHCYCHQQLCFFPALGLLLHPPLSSSSHTRCPPHPSASAPCPCQVRGGCCAQLEQQEGISPRRGAGDGRAEPALAAPEPAAAPDTPWGLLMGRCHPAAMRRSVPPARLSWAFPAPAKWGAWDAAQSCSHHCPAVDLGTASHFCQIISGVGDCCCFISSDIGLNICQTREPLFRLYYLRREYINTAEAVKIHSSIIICLIFEKCLLWNYFISKKKIYVSVFYNGYLWARRRFQKSQNIFNKSKFQLKTLFYSLHMLLPYG